MRPVAQYVADDISSDNKCTINATWRDPFLQSEQDARDVRQVFANINSIIIILQCDKGSITIPYLDAKKHQLWKECSERHIRGCFFFNTMPETTDHPQTRKPASVRNIGCLNLA